MSSQAMHHSHHIVAAALALGVPAGSAFADDLFTSFEFLDLSGEFTLGESPNTVTFIGGFAQSIGDFSLYHTGFSSWMIDAADTGTITFETPAQHIDLWFRDQTMSNNSILTILDAKGTVVASFKGTSKDWTNIVLTVDPAKGNPIGTITLQNNGAIGWSVIDDFSFCAAVEGGGPLADPIPEPIPQGAVHVKLDTVATGLTAPNWATHAPGDTQRLFVVDQNGILWAINLSTGSKTIFLDVTGRIVELGIFGPETFDERGLLGAAFHPQYPTNGLLYTYTSEPVARAADFSTMPKGMTADHHAVITEWQVPNPTDPASVVDPNSDRVLVRIDEPQFNHNAGAVNFGPDGMLYISLGDGGGADDQDGQDFLGEPMIGHGADGNGQNAENILGTVLRIDPGGNNSANGQYGIPADNPFVHPIDPRIDEIFAFGFRNPFRFSFDTVTGALYLADVGQNDIEEIDLVFSGGNYGWNLMEGSFFFDPNGLDPGFVTDVDPGVPPGLVVPVAQYDHDEGIAVIGGFVYRGTNIPPLAGRYVFGDWSLQFLANNGRLFYLEANQIFEFQLIGQTELGMSLLGFGQDADGEIYVLANTTGTPFGDTGVVLRIAPKVGDFDGDGVVGILDLLALLSAWGPCPDPPDPCPADLDGDGSVGILDLLTLLANWG